MNSRSLLGVCSTSTLALLLGLPVAGPLMIPVVSGQ